MPETPEQQAEQEVLNEGDPNCQHFHILYIDNAFDGQAFWCDNCPRHERIDYSPGFIMKFPVNALISTPNPKYGGEDFYAFRADNDGKAKTLDERVKREKK